MRGKGDRLPKEFKKYFWDVDFKTLSPKKYPQFILGRLLKFGDSRAVKWTLKTFNKAALKQFILNSKDLDKRSSDLWRLFFDLPPVKTAKRMGWPE